MPNTNTGCVILCIFLLSMLLIDPARAQDDVPGSERGFSASRPDTASGSHMLSLPRQAAGRPTWYQMFTNIPDDWVSSADAAVRGSSLPFLAGVAAITGGLILTDHQTYQASRDLYNRSVAVRTGSDALVVAGDGKTHLGLATAFALYGFLAGDSRSLRTASQTVESLLACGIAVQVMKRIAGRESPAAATSDRSVWRFLPNLRAYQRHQTRYYAFPSGHIATTMATVTVIAENYPEQTWIRPVGYALAGCLGVSLVNVRYHWFSDLPLGLLMGYTFGMIAAHRQDRLFALNEAQREPTVRIYPTLEPRGGGVALAVLF